MNQKLAAILKRALILGLFTDTQLGREAVEAVKEVEPDVVLPKLRKPQIVILGPIYLN